MKNFPKDLPRLRSRWSFVASSPWHGSSGVAYETPDRYLGWAWEGIKRNVHVFCVAQGFSELPQWSVRMYSRLFQ